MKPVPGSREESYGPAFFVFGKLFPSAVFAFLAAVQLDIFRLEIPAALRHLPELATVSFFLNRIMSIGFAALVGFVYVVRRPPAQAIHDPLTVAVSMYASFVLLGLRPLLLFLSVETMQLPGWSLIVSNVLVALGAGFSIYGLLYLRLNFSILPEARGLTTTGPYRLVRHPLYLGEIVAAAGLTIALPSLVSVLVLITFIGAQLLRTRLEERVLTELMPEYAGYARRTPRLFPLPRPRQS